MAKENVKKATVKKEVVVDEKEDNKEEDFLDEKKSAKKVNKENGEKSLFSKIMNIVLWIILLAWMAIVLIDYFRVTNEKDAVFCLSKHTTKYDDGNVKVCTGLGYKVYNYNRDSFKAIEFGPFWIKDRTADSDN